MRTLNQECLQKVETYVIEYQRENGQAPTYRQIMRDLHMSSLNQVQRYVKALERNGRIARTDFGSIDMLPQLRPGGTTMAYLVGDIACGNPTEAIENIEECYALPKALFGDGTLFMLRAYGDSMIDVGIRENDYVVLKQQNTANDGDMYTAFMVNKVELSVSDAYKNYTENQCGLLLKFLRKDQFAHLQNNPRMMKIIEKLTPVAIM